MIPTVDIPAAQKAGIAFDAYGAAEAAAPSLNKVKSGFFCSLLG